jgi:hypothetical protein
MLKEQREVRKTKLEQRENFHLNNNNFQLSLAS